MAVKKITISLDADLADEIRQDAEASSSTVSAWISEAARHALRSHYLRLAVEAYEAEHGAFTDEEKEATKRFWQESLSMQESSSPSIGATAEPGESSMTSSKRRAS